MIRYAYFLLFFHLEMRKLCSKWMKCFESLIVASNVVIESCGIVYIIGK